MNGIIPEFAFRSLRDAASQLRLAARDAGVELHPLPYSRFDPEDTTWWLSPVGDNPAYAFGKIVVERSTIVENGATIIGLHVEKGVGPSAAGIFEETARGRRLLMEKDWLWHAFARGMKLGTVDGDLAAAQKVADGLPLSVVIVASTQFPPRLAGEEDRPVNPDGVERAWYRPHEGALTLVDGETPKLLRALGARETLASIAAKIEAVDGVDWTWVEVLAGVPFRAVASGGLSASEVWRRACAPWLRWVR